MNATAPNPRIAAMADGRRADTARRRQRVIKALNDAATHGDDLTVTAIARTAGVDRTFLYRHRDLLGQVHIDELKQRIVHLEQQAVDLHIQLDERDQDIAAARAANRKLITQLNTRPTR